MSENVLYDSGAPQERTFKEENYACINDTPTVPPRPPKKQDKKPDCPANDLYTQTIKKFEQNGPNPGRNNVMNLYEDATINPIYDSWDI